jgi:hypothetical protein
MRAWSIFAAAAETWAPASPSAIMP